MSKFVKLTHELSKRGASDPEGLAAWIGRRKYGDSEFEEMALRGKRRTRRARKQRRKTRKGKHK